MSEAFCQRLEKATCDPWRAYLALEGRKAPFLLESNGADSSKWNRYSLVGAEPFLILSSQGDCIWKEKCTRVCFDGDPFQELRDVLAANHVDAEGFPFPFAGGAVGFFGYDLGRQLEGLPCWAKDDLSFPQMYFAFYDGAILFDHWENAVFLVGRAHASDAWQEPLRRALAASPPAELLRPVFEGSPESNFSQPAYLRALGMVKDYISAGDIYQVNLSQRFKATLANEASIASLYSALRRISPAPYSALIEMGNMGIASVSPECFLRLRGRSVTTCPIKGTRPRVHDVGEDEQYRRELEMSGKDAAELTMIVDLERNDLGKVCEIGSVKVAAHRRLESFSHVHHMISIVEGTLRADADAVDLVQAAFPGGSITGAPKLRAMEIIEEMEPTQRGPYTGAIGFLSFSGDMELNIAIRTLLARGRDVYYQAGGGIVADSDPEAEYQETLDKAANFFALAGGLNEQAVPAQESLIREDHEC